MHWQLMGPSGRIYKPKTETMLAYSQCIPNGTMQVGAIGLFMILVYMTGKLQGADGRLDHAFMPESESD